jgi:hypothetical protein
MLKLVRQSSRSTGRPPCLHTVLGYVITLATVAASLRDRYALELINMLRAGQLDFRMQGL